MDQWKRGYEGVLPRVYFIKTKKHSLKSSNQTDHKGQLPQNILFKNFKNHLRKKCGEGERIVGKKFQTLFDFMKNKKKKNKVVAYLETPVGNIMLSILSVFHKYI